MANQTTMAKKPNAIAATVTAVRRRLRPMFRHAIFRMPIQEASPLSVARGVFTTGPGESWSTRQDRQRDASSPRAASRSSARAPLSTLTML